MTTSRRGDIVLVSFVFADEKGVKKRPALVLSSDAYQAGREEIIVAAITSNLSRSLPGDRVVERWEDAGLPVPSVITGILRTIKREMVIRTLGTLPSPERRAYDKVLRGSLGLSA
jgi:mRNA interferase MazF